MPESNFIDYVKIMCRSGRGGHGSAHLHRAKYMPKGGPDGGDGGRGGHIFLKGNSNLWTLIHLKYTRHIFATDGAPGYENQCHGKDGEDRTIEVPCGTAVYDAETGEFLCDVTEDGQIVKLLRGGRGGLGNTHFKTATNQTPRYAQRGEDGVEKAVIIPQTFYVYRDNGASCSNTYQPDRLDSFLNLYRKMEQKALLSDRKTYLEMLSANILGGVSVCVKLLIASQVPDKLRKLSDVLEREDIRRMLAQCRLTQIRFPLSLFCFLMKHKMKYSLYFLIKLFLKLNGC